MRDLRLKKWAMLVVVLAACALSSANQDHPLDDKDIKLIDYADFGYPAIGVTARIEGVVVVRVTLDQNGKVLTADALSGAPYLVSASVENAKQWRFKTTSGTAIIVYNFRLTGTCHEGGGRSQLFVYPPNFVDIIACPAPLHGP